MQTFAERLRVRRHALGLSQEEVAGRAGVAPRSIVAWEAGTTIPSMRKATPVAAALGVEVAWLLTGQGELHVVPTDKAGGDQSNVRMGLRRLRAAVLDLYDKIQDLEAQCGDEGAVGSVKPKPRAHDSLMDAAMDPKLNPADFPTSESIVEEAAAALLATKRNPAPIARHEAGEIAPESDEAAKAEARPRHQGARRKTSLGS